MNSNKVIQILKHEYCNLAEEFNFDANKYPLRIISLIEYFNFLYENVYYDCIETASDLMDIINIDADSYERATMFSSYLLLDDSIEYQVVVPIEKIYKVLAETIATDKEIEEYFRLCIRHEVGHILYHIETAKKYNSAKDAIIAFNYSNHRAMLAYNKYIDVINEIFEDNEDMSEYDYHHILASKYYSYKSEHMANKIAKVDTKKLIKLELNVNLGLYRR